MKINVKKVLIDERVAIEIIVVGLARYLRRLSAPSTTGINVIRARIKKFTETGKTFNR